MSGDEWLRLTPAQMTPYILAWAAKQKREQQRLEAIDMMAAQIAWACAAPYQGKINDWRVFRRDSDGEQKPREKTAEEKRQESIARAKVAHAALRRARERKRKGKAK